VAGTRPTTIVIFRSREEMQLQTKRSGFNLLNPAFFDPERNEIYCACDLEKLGTELDAAKKQNQDLLKKINDTEAALKKQFKGALPKDRREEIEQARGTITLTNQHNAERLKTAKIKFYQMLYHEAFHAYLANFVYPPTEYEIPRWLNEGLAQIFEGAIIDGDELMVVRPDPKRLSDAKKCELVPLEDLLRAEPRKFLAFHESDNADSDRHYLTSWWLAYYLMFEVKKLGTGELNQYGRSLKSGSDPVVAFNALVGQQLPEFERNLHADLQNLQPNGMVKIAKPGHRK
jgi:hypothetical protein